MLDEQIFQVSEFNEFINAYLDGIGEVVIEGEISQLSVSKNTFLFMTIKDEEASVEVFGIIHKLPGYDILEEGMLVHVYGSPRIYEKTGRFSITAERVVPAGEGALKLAFEKLKQKLDKEGLFAIERKRKLPEFPEKIGLITAKNSRAYSDFIKVLKNRMGGLQILFCPVNVQGKDSVDTIVRAITYLNSQHPELDLIVLTRGGGSLEDLQSFNDEQVARAVFSSKIPLVSAIGHEEDVAICDLVSDLRASTPSNAAEIIVRNRRDVIKEIDYNLNTIERKVNDILNSFNNGVLKNVNSLKNAVNTQFIQFRKTITRFNRQFITFANRVDQYEKEVANIEKILMREIDIWLREQKRNLKTILRLLKTLDFRQVLKRGFSITFNENGDVITTAQNIKKDQKITTRFYDGRIKSEVFDIERN